MAKFFDSKKRKKRLAFLLGAALSATLALGAVSACATQPVTPEEPGDDTPTPTDTQPLKNGNFEFYKEMNKEFAEKRDLINSPSSYNWSFSQGSPSSVADSGIVKTDEWAELAASKFSLIREEDRKTTNDDGEEVEAESGTLSTAAADYATAHWEEASVYDRLEFYDFFGIDDEDEFALYEDYPYTISFDDVKELSKVEGGPGLHDASMKETGVLMIHNLSNETNAANDTARGTAQYYTSGTTVTLSAGTAARVSVWVKTAALYHYGADDDVEVTRRAGAYIGVTQTVGGTTLDQMQIKNIITENDDTLADTNGWKQYTVYIRANTFATTTFRIVLGLGQGSSTSRYEYVDGFAFFDDLTYKVLDNEEYAAETEGLNVPGENGNYCNLNTVGDENWKFYATDRRTGAIGHDTFNIDLSAEFEPYTLSSSDIEVSPTEERLSNGKVWTSENIDGSLYDNTRSDIPESRKSVVGVFPLKGTGNSLESLAAYPDGNGYLRNIYEKDFAGFPFENEQGIVLLLSTNGAAYTAKLPEQVLGPNSRMLLSFFVKTSSFQNNPNASGAGAVLVDGENKTSISPFISTNVAKVDIDDTRKDIYDGWVQCFFFVQNDTDEAKTFHIELTYGPTSIASTTVNDYCDGYAAFANFQIADMTEKQYGYAQTGTYAQKTTLTSTVQDSSKFDNAAASGASLEDGLATPATYGGIQAGSNLIVGNKTDEDGNVTNANPSRSELAAEGLYTGLLSHEYAENYAALDRTANPWLNTLNIPNSGSDWWKDLFGSKGTVASPAYQPLVLVNTLKDMPSYGFTDGKTTTISANSATKITVRLKLSVGAVATIYLVDVSGDEDTVLTSNLPKLTYWYDDDGNLVNMDPADDNFEQDGKILFTLESNGLYKNAQDDNDDNFYANLANFDRDDDGNYVTTNGKIAFYHNPGDADANTAYAYYDKDTKVYSQPVLQIPAATPTRYSGIENANYEASIRVEGTEANYDDWITVSFYVQTGNAAKNYRLELWAGDRDNATDGIKAGDFIFFERCVTSSSISNYASVLEDTVSKIKRAGGIGEKENVPGALYYAFTFFDSPDYLRYDKTQDEKQLGNPWGEYVQSANEENLVYLFAEDADGELLGTTGPSYTKFLSFASNEVTVEEADLGQDNETDTDSGNNTTTDSDEDNQNNLWLSLVSILLVVALVFAIAVVCFRRLRKNKKSKAPKAKKPAKRFTPAPAKQETAESEKPEAKEPEIPEERDENDPYNE